MWKSQPYINTDKNLVREAPSFANINLLGKCNVNCFFCLGKDIEKELSPHYNLNEHFMQWGAPSADGKKAVLGNFQQFLNICKEDRIEKIYITGQNTDSLLYGVGGFLYELMDYLHQQGFKVGLRTNGYALDKHPILYDSINKCTLSVGYSVHSLNPMTTKMILGTNKVLNWADIFEKTTARKRVSVVVNRCNHLEFFELLHFLKNFDLSYVQARRISTDTRKSTLLPDMVAYEQLYTQVRNTFELKKTLWHDAEVYDIFGLDVVFWRTVKTSVNSYNYFTDGTISREYFVVEGYLKNRKVAI